MKTHAPALALVLALGLVCSRTAAAGPEVSTIPGRGAFDEFDSVLPLPPAEEGVERFALGDIHGYVHVYEGRDGAYAEVWISDYLESAVSGLMLADVDLDGLREILAYTEGGRIHLLDLGDYHSLWSNPATDYESLSALAVHDVDDDEQPELLFVADGRLVIYDGRDRFEEWRSDQDNLTSTDVLVGDVDGDGADEIVLNDGFVFDARYRDLEWQSPESFGERIGLLDVDDDEIPEVVGEFGGRFLRIFDIDLRRMKSARP